MDIITMRQHCRIKIYSFTVITQPVNSGAIEHGSKMTALGRLQPMKEKLNRDNSDQHQRAMAN